jgi:hypothetical protein
MRKEEYRAILSRLPLKSPTTQDMAMICPHLTPEKAVNAFSSGPGLVALPPLRVRHAFQIASYHAEWAEEVKVWREDNRVVTGTKNHPAHVSYLCASRTYKSYADGKTHGDVFSKYAEMDKAMKFAEDNWGDELILDNWVDIIQTYIQDPTDLVNDKHHRDAPRTKAALSFTLNRDLYKLINDHSKPRSELYDDAIMEMTIDHAVYNELKGGRGDFTHFNCAHCGHGLGLSGCNGCGHRFRDDQARTGMYTPLSRRMVAFLRANGHEFKVDPELAWKNERKHWESYTDRRQ